MFAEPTVVESEDGRRMKVFKKRPGKENKLKVGQKVRAKKSLIDWYAERLCWLYSRSVINPPYGKGEMEFDKEDLGQIYILLHSHLSGKMPYGVVKHYGSTDSIKVGRLNVFITFTVKTEIGTFSFSSYCSEDKLVRIVKKVKKG
jgi:hypothetical protein